LEHTGIHGWFFFSVQAFVELMHQNQD